MLETNTRVQGMIKGDFQGTDGYLPYDQILRLKQAKNVQILEAESMRVFYFIIHNGRGADERRALPPGARPMPSTMTASSRTS